jgi:hypothetical protein
VIVPGPDGQAIKGTRTFATMSDELEALVSGFAGLGVTRPAMESIVVYWKPVFNLLDKRFQILVVIAEHIAALSERETDVQDAEHLASWAGMGPSNNESAGKRKSGKTRKVSPWLRRASVEAVQGAARTKNMYSQALYITG